MRNASAVHKRTTTFVTNYAKENPDWWCTVNEIPTMLLKQRQNYFFGQLTFTCRLKMAYFVHYEVKLTE